MITLLRPLPREIIIAVSGGIDSMAALDFLRRNHKVSVAYFDHGTDHGTDAREFVGNYCDMKAVPFFYKKIEGERTTESPEEFWRIKRYEFLHSFDLPVITAHTIDDCVETWIWSSLHGESKIIPYSYKNVIRPFLLTSKQDLQSWCLNKKIDWIEDPSNCDTKYRRNLIRHDMMPYVLKISPGIAKVIRKKLIDLNLVLE